MRKLISLSIVASFAMSVSVYAESGDATPTLPIAPQVTEASPTPTPTPTPETEAVLTAAPNPTATIAPQLRPLGSALGEFKSVSCDTNPAFGTNSCDQCFDGGSIKVGATLNGLFDNWLNNTSNILVAYKEEQKMPNMVRLGNTTWIANPADDTKFWKYSSDVVWVQAGSGGKNQYILPAGQSVKFFESDLGAGYKLEKTDRKNGEAVGILRVPVVSHIIDASANEGPAVTAYECAAISLAASESPATPEQPKPTPKEITSTKTGPETLLLIVAAFFIAFGLMFSLRKRV